MVAWSLFIFLKIRYSNTFETFIAQAERFASGVPRKQFARIAKKEVKHKL